MWMAAGGVLLALLAAGVGVPVPEDATLLGAGYLVWRGTVPFALIWAVGVFGILAGDSSLYWIGRKLGPRLTRHRWLTHHLTPARLRRVEHFFERHGAKSVLLARWLAGARGAFYLTAGTMKLPYRRFLVFDALAACLSVSFWIFLGWRFGNRIDFVRHEVKHVELIVLVVLAAVLVAWLGTKLVRRWIQGPAEPA